MQTLSSSTYPEAHLTRKDERAKIEISIMLFASPRLAICLKKSMWSLDLTQIIGQQTLELFLLFTPIIMVLMLVDQLINYD